ncbi:hypothetical protein G3R49_00535 [Shewanella sp. WXL01]|uniref:Uncharacterized protein n=1 Tax=Shewanella maritima TaxID=2520507 RepID=A0A411PGW7_9GAMM|nr:MULTISPECIES: hypothetical protein [Shewanella]NKF49062.1 hypothetical protein [Shewanella sp. WXL01]QBF82795.1 hypothetical protein EXU30_08900 [Shewanella maritima]
MGSKSALKKLKKLHKKSQKLQKKSQKLTNKSLKQLNALTANPGAIAAMDPELREQVGQLSEQVIGSMVSELIQPLNPVMSWLNDGAVSMPISRRSVTPTPNLAANSSIAAANTATHSASSANAAGRIAIAQVPLKSPPCKKCPARMGGNCKCAMKKFNL